MYNLRYHIASLVSVFLALALGLVLGGLAVGRGMIDRQEGALVEGLQKEFAQLRAENRELAADNALHTGLSDSMVDSWASGRLEGRTIVLLASAGMDDGVVDARQAIEDAGGRVAIVTMLRPGLGLEDEELGSAVASLAPDPQNPERSIVASLAAEWTSPGRRQLTQALVDAEVLSVDGLEEIVVPSGLVGLAAPDGKSDPVGISLLRAFATAPGPSARVSPAIGAQTEASDTGVAPAAADAGLSAIDTLGTDIGRYSLIALLTGAEQGYYGVARGADAAFPPVPAQ